MNDVEFERLLSYKPVIDRREQPCLRDLIFNHFGLNSDDRASNNKTRYYTDELYKQLVNRKA